MFTNTSRSQWWYLLTITYINEAEEPWPLAVQLFSKNSANLIFAKRLYSVNVRWWATSCGCRSVNLNSPGTRLLGNRVCVIFQTNPRYSISSSPRITYVFWFSSLELFSFIAVTKISEKWWKLLLSSALMKPNMLFHSGLANFCFDEKKSCAPHLKRTEQIRQTVSCKSGRGGESSELWTV